MVPLPTKLEEDKSSGQMIWTNFVRPRGYCTRMYCNQTRKEIGQKLEATGWVIQDKKRINLYESLGLAVREMDTDTGPADYMLFIDGKACGILAQEIVEQLEAALEEFQSVEEVLASGG